MRITAPLVLVVVGIACRPPRLPGESLGEFRVRGVLDENTCGEGLPADPEIAFAVELRKEGSVGYWKLSEGPLVSGRAEREGRFEFVQSISVDAIAADPSVEFRGCTLEQRETVGGTLASASDAGVGTSALTGTSVIRVSPVAGSDCSPLLLQLGGAFVALPCTATYTLTGDRSP